MQFVRKRKKGSRQKSFKAWFSECGNYRITWASECFGVRVRPHFHACVRTFRGLTDDYKQWDFAGRRRPYKTYEAAEKACLHHQKIWQRVLDVASQPGPVTAIKVIKEREKLVLSALPIWARKHCTPLIYKVLFPQGRKDKCEDTDQDDPGAASVNSAMTSASGSESVSNATSSTPASSAMAAVESTILQPSVSMKRGRKESVATDAKAQAKAVKKPARKSTKPASKGGRKTSRRGAKKKATVEVA